MRQMQAVALLGTASAFPAEIARWEAGRAGRGITIEQAEGFRWTLRQEGGSAVAVVEPSRDYFCRAGYQIRTTVSRSDSGWLVLEYLDRGYALVTTTPGVAQSRQRGVARLNTGKFRRAVFHFEKAAFEGTIRVEGIEFLRSVSITDLEPPKDPIPDAPPALSFARHSQRVTTAGADAATPDGLPETLAAMRNLLPLAKALGFNGIESYVKWNFIERSPGVFDWSFYDAVVDQVEKHGMQWFPPLIVGSAYTLPEWFYESPDNRGFACLEHG